MPAWSRAQLRLPPSRPKAQVMTPKFQQARSRPQIDVATSLCSSHINAPVATQNLGRDTKPQQGSQNHVATSNRCRDTTQATPGRDLKTGSRHRFSCPAPSQVATPKPGRDPPGGYPMSRHQFHVATSFFPKVGFRGRDLPHCYPCRDLKNDVATSNPTG